METRMCKSCEVTKPLNNFPRSIKKNKVYYRYKCKTCTYKDDGNRFKERYANDPSVREAEKTRRSKRDPLERKLQEWFRLYGIDKEEARQVYLSHSGKCDICGNKCSTGTALALDHCHVTGKIRGMLCTNCNKALGLLGDNLEGVMRAVRYLEKL